MYEIKPDDQIQKAARNTLETLKKNNISLETAFEKLFIKNVSLENALSRTLDENLKLNQGYQKIASELSEQQKKNQKISQEYSKEEENLQREIMTVREVQKAFLEANSSDKSKLSQEIVEVKKKNKTLQEENSFIEKKNKDLQSENLSLIEKNKELAQKIDFLEENMSKLQSIFAQLERLSKENIHDNFSFQKKIEPIIENIQKCLEAAHQLVRLSISDELKMNRHKGENLDNKLHRLMVQIEQIKNFVNQLSLKVEKPIGNDKEVFLEEIFHADKANIEAKQLLTKEHEEMRTFVNRTESSLNESLNRTEIEFKELTVIIHELKNSLSYDDGVKRRYSDRILKSVRASGSLFFDKKVPVSRETTGAAYKNYNPSNTFKF